MSPEKKRLNRVWRQIALRHGLVQFWHAAQVAFFLAALILLIWVLLDRLLFLPLGHRQLAVILLIALVGGVLSILRHIRASRALLCYRVDQATGGYNLLGAAFSLNAADDEVAEQIQQRALNHLCQHPVSAAFPFQIRWTTGAAVAFSFLAIAALFLPERDLLGRHRAMLKAQKARESLQTGLEELAKQLEKPLEKKTLNALKELGPPIESDLIKLLRELKKTQAQDALRKIAAFEEKYAKTLADADAFRRAVAGIRLPDSKKIPKNTRESFQRLAKQLSDPVKLADAAKNLKKLAQRLQNPKISEANRQKIDQALRQLTQQILATANQTSTKQESTSELTKRATGILRKSAAANRVRNGLAAVRKKLSGNQTPHLRFKPTPEIKLAKNVSQKNSQGERKGTQPATKSGNLAKSGNGKAVAANGKNGKGRSGQNGKSGNGSRQGTGQGNGAARGEKSGKVRFQEFRLTANEDPNGEKQTRFMPQTEVGELDYASPQYRTLTHTASRAAIQAMAQNRVPRYYERLVKAYFNSLTPPADLEPKP